MDSNYYNMQIEKYSKEANALQFALQTILKVPTGVENTDNLLQLCEMLTLTRRTIEYYAADKAAALAKEQTDAAGSEGEA